MNVGLHPSVVRHIQILALTGGGALDVLEWWCSHSFGSPRLLKVWCQTENEDQKLLFVFSLTCTEKPGYSDQHHMSVQLCIRASSCHPSSPTPLDICHYSCLLVLIFFLTDVAKNENCDWVTQYGMILTSMLTIEILLPRHTSPIHLTNDDLSPAWREEAIIGL